MGAWPANCSSSRSPDACLSWDTHGAHPLPVPRPLPVNETPCKLFCCPLWSQAGTHQGVKAAWCFQRHFDTQMNQRKRIYPLWPHWSLRLWRRTTVLSESGASEHRAAGPNPLSPPPSAHSLKMRRSLFLPLLYLWARTQPLFCWVISQCTHVLYVHFLFFRFLLLHDILAVCIF